jgi:NTE family protein
VIGLALEGGGALGLAHIGVLLWFEKNHIPVDRISGTSMGALIGGMYASGLSVSDIEKIAESKVFSGIFTVEVPFADVSFRRREDRRELPQAITLGLRGGPSLRNALIADGGLNSFLSDNLLSYNRSELNYDTLPIPFRCVATDLDTMQPVVFDNGPLPQAIRASISIPGIFSPVQYRNHYLVDGAILDNLPTDIARQDLHSDVVIGVHLESAAFTESDVSSIVGVFARAFAAGTARNELVGKKGADILIDADTSKFSTGDYGKASELIQVGYQAAAKNGAALLKYALDDASWKAYQDNRQQRTRPHPATLDVAKVEGGSAAARQTTQTDLEPLIGKPIDGHTLDGTLRQVQGNGTFQASYDTYQATTTQSPADRTQAPGPDNGIVVHLSPVHNGPPFLLFGLDTAISNSNVTRNTTDFRLLNTDLGGFGSELRTDVRFGFLTQLSTEYYRRLNSSGYFVQPTVGIIRQPVYLWQNQVRISEHLEQQAGGGLDVGRTFNNHLQTSLEYRAQVVRWHLVTGQDGTPEVSGTTQTAVARLSYDSTRSGAFSPEGLRFNLVGGALFRSAGSENAPMAQIQFDKTFRISDKDSFASSIDASTYFRRNVAEPLRFTVGGPLRLSASSIDEYRGTDTALLRDGYLRRIANLPAGYGQGLYAGFGYEAASIWSPERHSILRQDGILSIIGITPVGALTFGTSIGDAGRRKVFFTYGRLF